jgi:hypothetical protein
MLEVRRGNLDAARAGLERARALGNDNWQWIGMLGMHRATVERLAGDLDAARAELEQVVRSMEQGPDSRAMGYAQRTAALATVRAQVELDAGDRNAAGGYLAEAIRWALESKDGPVTAVVAETAARLALAGGDAERAAGLLGVAAAQRGEPDRGNPEVRALDAALRRELGDEAADAAMQAARELPRAAGLKLLEGAVPAVRLIS